VTGGPGPRAAREELRAAFGADVAAVELEVHRDERGTLTATDLDALPFTVRRLFRVSEVPAGTARGGHGHVRGVQALFCTRGRIEVELRRGGHVVDVTLEADGIGLQIGAGIWSEQRYVVGGSELLVLASEPYDPGTYDPTPT
jgi:dTDP-4-dehydrorhamnose 3,5-epimerase-like enzyme